VPTIEISNSTYHSINPAPQINDAAHGGRVLRALALPNISVIIRAIVAALPASFWVSVLQLVIRLLPYLTTKAMNGAAMGVLPSQVEDAIVRSE